MVSPFDADGPLGADHAPPSKTFTVEEANRLLPTIDRIFHEMDNRNVRLKEVDDLIQDLEAYWGDRLASPDLPDRERYLRLLRERDDLHASLGEDLQRIRALGVLLKDYTTGLVDFFGYLDGELVFLCWQRGETGIKFYHSLEGGYSGRRPLAKIPQK